jgi:hypothetical protein
MVVMLADGRPESRGGGGGGNPAPLLPCSPLLTDEVEEDSGDGDEEDDIEVLRMHNERLTTENAELRSRLEAIVRNVRGYLEQFDTDLPHHCQQQQQQQQPPPPSNSTTPNT